MTLEAVIRAEYKRNEPKSDPPILQKLFAEWWVRRFPDGGPGVAPQYLFEAFQHGYDISVTTLSK